MSDNQPCPQCGYEYPYPSGLLMVCPDCNHEWNEEVSTEVEDSSPDELIVLDSNGNRLADGDSVVVIKDLPVKGMPKSIKSGTKVKNIKLKEGDHNIDCKIDGFGAMALKSEFVKKA